MEGKNKHMHRAYIGLGSNLGDRESCLAQALRLLDGHPDIRVAKVSSLYQTDPVGYTDQPLFLNMAAALDTRLPAEELLTYMLDVERKLGRTRDIRWGPRTIDLDLLTYGKERIETADLCVPHPRMRERAFVLIPLEEIIEAEEFPEWENAQAGAIQPVGREGVKRWKTMHWRDASEPSAN